MSDLLDRMRANPDAGWRLADIEKLCREFGVRWVPPRGGGSHYKVSHPSQPHILTVPFRRPIKRVYILKLVRYLEGFAHTTVVMQTREHLERVAAESAIDRGRLESRREVWKLSIIL